MVMRFLLNTALGDLLCALIERVTGCALVPLSDLDYQIAATGKGKAATERAPASGS